MDPSLSSIFCLPSSSSSSSSSKPDLAAPTRIPPNAALPPASENGVDATAVPNTLADFGAPNVAKSCTTFRGGDAGADNLLGEDGGLLGEEESELYDAYEERERLCLI